MPPHTPDSDIGIRARPVEEGMIFSRDLGDLVFPGECAKSGDFGLQQCGALTDDCFSTQPETHKIGYLLSAICYFIRALGENEDSIKP
jgi:hypothetical protein